MEMIWTTTPPSVPGYYWIKWPQDYRPKGLKEIKLFMRFNDGSLCTPELMSTGRYCQAGVQWAGANF